MKKLRIHFCDFWSGWSVHHNFFTKVLASKFELEFDAHDPELVIYSLFGTEHCRYYCRKICFIGENKDPDFSQCDAAFSFRNTTHNNYRLPLYILFDSMKKYHGERPLASYHLPKTAFCNFLYSNPGPRERKRFFHLLQQYKRVDAGGRIANNIGYRVADKLAFVENYKFSIAFENSSRDGYVTEKIFQPLTVGSIPIYWGAPDVARDFNPKAFINCHDYASFQEVVERVREIDCNDDEYTSMLREPIFNGAQLSDNFSDDNISAFVEKIINSDLRPVAQQTIWYKGGAFTQKIAQLSRKVLFKVSILQRHIKNFHPDLLRFRRDPYSINNKGDDVRSS